MRAAANNLFFGDNLEIMRERIAGGSVDLVYLDPPFNSNRNYNVIFNRHGEAKDGNAGQIQAFSDAWRWTHATEEQYAAAAGGGLPPRAADALTAMRALLGENDAMAYLVNMAPRLAELHRVLKPTGSLYLHCDPTMSHYLKILLDAIFGPRNFRNEIVWAYKGAQVTRSRFPAKHDIIFWYSKGSECTFNHVSEGHSAAQLSRYNVVDENGDRWANMKGKLRKLPSEGRSPTDVWEINALTNNDKERLGYPTQKPVALLERIIAASSNPGDVVLDPFCGCGTTIDAAHRLGRRWTGIDITYIAIDLIDKRLKHRYPGITDYEIHGIPKDMGGARALFSHSPFDFERWAVSQVGAQPNEKQVGDKGTDGTGRFPLDSKGTVGKMLVSVKGGKTVGPTAVRDLSGTVHAQKAQMGVLVTMEPPTRGVTDAADHGGSYTWPPNGQTFPRIQVITVAELLAGKQPGTPPLLLPYVAAVKAHIPAVQQQLVPEGS